MDRRSAYRDVRTGLLLASAAILAFGLTFVFAVFYLV